MFKIYDGRECFYQWDLNRQLVIEDPAIKQVHFCNRTSDCSLVVETHEQDGLLVADVPNILLQTNWDVRAYAFDGNATLHEQWYEVKTRTKPDNYVYTETEILNYESISKRMDALESDIEGVAEEVINKYLEENPIDVDLTGYATEKYVDDAISTIELTPGPAGKDGKDYVLTDADKKEIAGMVEVTGEGGVTEEFVEEYVDGELSRYATKKYVDSEIEEALEAFTPTTDSEIVVWDDTYSAEDGSVKLTSAQIDKFMDCLDKEVAIYVRDPDDKSEYTFTTTCGYAESGDIIEFYYVMGNTDGVVDSLRVDIENRHLYVTLTNKSQEIDLKISIPADREYYTKEEIDDMFADVGDGESGIYVGETEPTDDSLIWINPNGDEVTQYATMAEVEAAINTALAAIVDGEEVAY